MTAPAFRHDYYRVRTIPVRPHYVELIASRRKLWEFRPRPLPCGVPMLIYASAPVSRVVGVIEFLGRPVMGTAEDLLAVRWTQDGRIMPGTLPGVDAAELASMYGTRAIYAHRIAPDELRFCGAMLGAPPIPAPGHMDLAHRLWPGMPALDRVRLSESLAVRPLNPPQTYGRATYRLTRLQVRALTWLGLDPERVPAPGRRRRTP